VRPLETSYHLENPPRISFPPELPDEMVTIPTAANNAISYGGGYGSYGDYERLASRSL
jgi:hypothetical protein